MTDEKTVTEVMPPVSITVIGTGDGIVKGAKATTPPDMPNVVFNVVPAFVALAVRFGHTYVGMVVGLLGVSMTSNALPATDFTHLLLKCCELALGGAVVLSLKDVVTIFGRLEEKYPLLSGGV